MAATVWLQQFAMVLAMRSGMQQVQRGYQLVMQQL
jgi:hypothetical protein